MTLKPIGRAVKASMLSLAMALGVTACSNDYTVSYVYMTTSKTLPHGLINAYQVDYQSGYLYTLADSPVDAGGRDTVGLVVAPNNLFLYTVNNFDSDVVEFAIGTDGKLYPQNTYNIAGSLPTAAAIDAAGKFLYVTFTYQNNPNGSELYTPANPGPGGIRIFPINSNNTLGTPTTVNVGRNPVAITTSASGNYVYVIEQDSASYGQPAGLLGEHHDRRADSAGRRDHQPGQCAVDRLRLRAQPQRHHRGRDRPRHLYVTDQTLNQVATYSIANGIPTLVATATTDAGPMGMAFDLSHKYLYVTAYTANALDGFTVGANGVPVRSTVAGSVQTGTGPTCVTISGAPSNANPSHAVYLYTSNQLSNNLTGEQLSETDGSLDQIQGAPFGGSALPTCAVTVPAFPLR